MNILEQYLNYISEVDPGFERRQKRREDQLWRQEFEMNKKKRAAEKRTEDSARRKLMMGAAARKIGDF